MDKGESSWMWVKARDLGFRRKKFHKVGGVHVCICVCVCIYIYMYRCMYAYMEKNEKKKQIIYKVKFLSFLYRS